MIVYSNQFMTFLMTLMIAGIGFGMTLIMANTLLSELMPQKHRGRSLVFVSFIAILGKFFAILAAYSFELKNWKTPEYFLAFVGILLPIIIFFKVPESFRILLMKGEFNESIQIIDQLLQ